MSDCGRRIYIAADSFLWLAASTPEKARHVFYALFAIFALKQMQEKWHEVIDNLSRVRFLRRQPWAIQTLTP